MLPPPPPPPVIQIVGWAVVPSAPMTGGPEREPPFPPLPPPLTPGPPSAVVRLAKALIPAPAQHGVPPWHWLVWAPPTAPPTVRPPPPPPPDPTCPDADPNRPTIAMQDAPPPGPSLAAFPLTSMVPAIMTSP